MQDLETWLEQVYRAGGDHATLAALYDEWARDYDQQLWASGNPCIAVAAGVLTHGHAPPEAIDGLLGLARDGAVMVLSLSQIAFDEYGFRKKIESRVADGSWQKLDQSRLFRTYPFSDKEAHLRHWVLVYRKS